jgi:hypothetical protein
MTQEQLPVRAAEQPTALDLIAGALKDDSVDPAKLKALLDVKKEWEADEARKAFSEALARFQAEAPIIAKLDTAHNKKYARLDRIWAAIKPLLAECRLSITWRKVEVKDGMCHIEGALGHALGHSVELSHDIPLPDSIKGQNKAQQAASGTTYAKRYALCAALGIVTGDDNDGNGGGEVITEKEANLLQDMVREKGRSMDKLLVFGGCSSLEGFPRDKYEQAMAMLEGVK